MSETSIMKIDYITVLQEEIRLLESRYQPEDTGHLRTAVSVLRERVEELKVDLRQLEDLIGRGDLG